MLDVLFIMRTSVNGRQRIDGVSRLVGVSFYLYFLLYFLYKVTDTSDLGK